MKLDLALAAETEATTCFLCGKPIVNGDWFARIRDNSQRVIFCRPRCVELFLERSGRIAPDRFFRPVTEEWN